MILNEQPFTQEMALRFSGMDEPNIYGGTSNLLLNATNNICNDLKLALDAEPFNRNCELIEAKFGVGAAPPRRKAADLLNADLLDAHGELKKESVTAVTEIAKKLGMIGAIRHAESGASLPSVEEVRVALRKAQDILSPEGKGEFHRQAAERMLAVFDRMEARLSGTPHNRIRSDEAIRLR